MRSDVKLAVLGIYEAIERARIAQNLRGKKDQGQRMGITSGHHFDMVTELITKELSRHGFNREELYTKGNEVKLPGWFRPAKEWDILGFDGKKLITAIELKSINSSFGNNSNNRVEEALGSVYDATVAYSEKLFGNSSIPPVMGYVMIIRDCKESQKASKPIKSPHFPIDPIFDQASYLERFKILCKRLRAKNLYNAIWLVYVDPDNKIVTEPDSDLSFEKFIVTIVAGLMIHKA